MKKRHLALAALPVCLLILAVCTRTPSQSQPEVRIWTTADGGPVPPRLIQMRTGVEHCGWETAWFLETRNPGDTELIPVTQNFRQFVLDPEGVVASDALKTTYEADSDLPHDAVFTGYVSEGAELWVSESTLDTAVFLVSENQAERLPSTKLPLYCN